MDTEIEKMRELFMEYEHAIREENCPVEKVRELLEEGLSIDARTEDSTALIIAAECGRLDVVTLRWRMKTQKSPNSCDGQGPTKQPTDLDLE